MEKQPVFNEKHEWNLEPVGAIISLSFRLALSLFTIRACEASTGIWLYAACSKTSCTTTIITILPEIWKIERNVLFTSWKCHNTINLTKDNYNHLNYKLQLNQIQLEQRRFFSRITVKSLRKTEMYLAICFATYWTSCWVCRHCCCSHPAHL